MTDEVRDPLLTGSIPQQPRSGDAELRTFLIADIRGYTSFTQRNGDEAAAKIAAKFAQVAREVVESHDGSVLELRGDEALCVFVSPRGALRAAVALQQRFVDETRWDSSLPLPVGIGIDIGEAVQVEGGYRGGALNLAARLCSMAGPGEVLATAEVTHLAQRLDGLTYQARDPVRLKGITDPVRPVRVVPVGDDPAQQLGALGALPPKPAASGPAWVPARLRRHPRLALVAVAVAVALVIAGVGVAVRSDGGGGLSSLDENVAAVLDLRSGVLRAQAPVGAAPGAVAVGDGAVWVANTADGTVSRVDARRRTTVQTTQVGSAPTGVAVGGGSVWVANSGSGDVTRIDPATSRVTATIPTGAGPTSVAFSAGRLWVVDTIGGTLLALDPATGGVEVAARLAPDPRGIVATAADVWVSSAATGTVAEYDIRARAVVQTVHVGNDPRGLALSNGSLWVTNDLDGTVTRVDARTGSVVATLPVGSEPVAVAADGDDVWVAASTSAWLTRIDARRNRVLGHVPTASAPTGLAVSGGSLWLAAASDPALHRGGTETAVITDPVNLDPAFGYDESSESVGAMLYDGLLGVRRTSGADGGTVVPDLATALPDVTDGGRTLTFRMRSGVRWSNGAEVTGANIRRGLERTVAAGNWQMYDGIVGARACRKTRCDLSRGISVDAAARLVTIRLTRPDPDFVNKLALLGAVAVPSSTPFGPLGRSLLPSTGPYQVASTSSRRTELVRNPKFHEWSSAAQPAGYPDRVVVEVRPDASRPLSDRQLGSVDWSTLHNTPDLPALQARWGDRVRVTPFLATHYVALNTQVAPFRDVRVRRAVAYSIDRAAAAAHWPLPGTVTCQLMPPGIPGRGPFCPYTLRRDLAGQWHAPDVVTAQQLVRSAGAEGARVTVFTPPGPRPGMAVVVAAMRSAGLDARLRVLPEPIYFTKFSALMASGAAQAGFSGWLADYPSAANFVDPLLTCASRGPQGLNDSRFCNRAFDRRVAAAEHLQATDPAAATVAWARIDRIIVNLAPLVPLVNPARVDVISARLKNFHRNSVVGALYDQAWVR